MQTLRKYVLTAKSSLGLVVAAIAAVSLSACSAGGSSHSALSAKQHMRQVNRESAVKPWVSVTNQMTDGYSVTVAHATYPKNAVTDSSAQGVVTVAPLVNGRPGDIAGFTVVRHGTSTNLKVPVQVQLTSGTYRVALYPGGKAPSDALHALTWKDVTLSVLSS